MLDWLKVSLLLCTFGFLREFRPSEPYVSEFILGEWRNITEETLNKNVYPVGTYFYLPQLVIVFLVTDYLKYKPLVVVCGACGVIVYSLLLWTVSLEWLQTSQFFYGLFIATEVAYYTYIFAKVDEEHYEKVSSWTRAANLIGRFLSGVCAQLLVSFQLMNFRTLNYITFATQVLCMIWAILLPSVDRSVYFHREVKSSVSADASTAKPPEKVDGLLLLWEHARSAYRRPTVLAWSLWYATSTGFFIQIQFYIQLLWREISPNQETLYNGSVEAVLTVLGAGAALLAGRGGAGCAGSGRFLPLITVLVSAIQATAVLFASMAQNVLFSYFAYAIIGALYHYMITIASSEIARRLVYDSCFGLIFGINTMGAAVIQALLTFSVISNHGFELSIRDQFKAYACCYLVLSIVALVICVYVMVRRCRRIDEKACVNVQKVSRSTQGPSQCEIISL